jgi:hypothetical protein
MTAERASDLKVTSERLREARRRLAMQRDVIQRQWRALTQSLELLEEYERSVALLRKALEKRL